MCIKQVSLFLEKKYPVIIQTHTTQIVYITVLFKDWFKRIYKDHLCKNEFPITFGLALLINNRK